MNVFKEFHAIIIAAVKELFNDADHITDGIVVEAPRDENHGDLSTNAAMVLASKVSQSPRSIAEKIKASLERNQDVSEISIAGPGFINIKLKLAKWQQILGQVLKAKDHYGDTDIGKDKYINVEYVSCNPTGPMHIGHARGAVYGDVLANILQRCGFRVVREFYINDAGAQVADLARSVLLRYKESVTKQEVNIPSGLYPGEYLIPVGNKLAVQYPDNSLDETDLESIKSFAVTEMMSLIKGDLKALGISHDVFFSEQTLHTAKKIDQIIDDLTLKGFIYKGTLPAPKGKVHENWQPQEQLLFKTTDFGDDQDRPLQKADGTWTYFAAEVAYFKDKIERGFDKVILILGADHGGYIKRSEAVVSAINNNVECVIKTCQLVNYVQGGVPMKMSKRSGEFLTVRDIIDLVGRDVVRFMMLTRKNDTVFDFDVATAVECSKDNPVFYVQYAHVRNVSILNNAKENASDAYKLFSEEKYDLNLLTLNSEISLIKKLALWPKILESSAIFFEPHRIAFYLENLASEFHGLWNFSSEGESYRFIEESKPQLTAARLALAEGVKSVIAQGLSLIGAEPMQKM